MNRNTTFVRKVIYIAAIALLLIPLSWLGQPATREAGSEQPTGGGKIARLRDQYNLSQADLGEIDPASETMKLATLGLRGVAANLLWDKANEYKKKEDWNNLRATLNQITKIQPNFISVWEFQAHNLSYNVSVEFDHYRDRYHWVKKGIDFLMDGTRYNRNEPRLLWDVGWFIAQKIGQSDERRQYRRLFRKDEEFHRLLDRYVDIEQAKDPYGQYDNWLMGRLWYLDAYRLVETKGASMRGKSPLIYYADAPLTRINFAKTLEEEFDPGEGEIPQFAWKQARDDWHAYGDRQILSSWGTYLRLNGLHAAHMKVAKLRRQLNELVPGVEEQMRQERIADLPEEARAALKTPPEKRTRRQREVASFLDRNTLEIPAAEIAEKAPKAVRRQAKELARLVREAEVERNRIEKYRSVVNYDYWEVRCAAEATDEAIRARKHMYDAHRLYAQAKLEKTQLLDEDGKPIPLIKDGKPVYDENGKPVYKTEDGAKEKYEKAWDEWAKVFKQYPGVVTETLAEELAPAIVEYRRVLQNLDQEELPADFKLTEILDLRNGRDGLPTSQQLRTRYEALSTALSAQQSKGDQTSGEAQRQKDEAPAGGDREGEEKAPSRRDGPATP